MKVLHIHNRYRVPGGENRMFELIVDLLRQHDHVVEAVERDSLDIKTVNQKLFSFFSGIYSHKSYRLVNDIITRMKPDVAHVHNVFPLLSPSVIVACADNNVPVVMRTPNYRMMCPRGIFYSKGKICTLCMNGREYHCLLKNCRNNMLESIAVTIRGYIARKKRFFLDNVTYFLPPSEFARSKYLEAGFTPEQFIVLPNMVHIPDVSAKPSTGKYILFAGRVTPEKGVVTLVKAASKMNVPVIVAGNYSVMPDLAESAPGNVTFTGHVKRDKIPELFYNARIVVQPSEVWDVFPVSVSEAMSYGLPVVGTRLGGIPELVDEGVTGDLFEYGNHEELSSTLMKLWNDPERCDRYGKAAREKTMREYSSEKYYERLMDIYASAMNGKGNTVSV